MPAAPSPNSGGKPESKSPGSPSQLPYGKPGGEIVLSREEAMALTVLETEEDHPNAMKRASKETGLTSEQIKKLRQRAEKARSSGYTLRGGNITLKPKNYEQEAPKGLLGDIMGDQKHVGKATKGSPAKGSESSGGTKAKESNLHECAADGTMCEACRLKSARRRMTEARRRRKSIVVGTRRSY